MKFKLFSNDLGVDLGTSNTLIYNRDQGIQIREPSVVAMDKNTGKILAVGTAAKNMLGRTPGNVVAMHPLSGGVISDHEMTVRLLQELFRKASKRNVLAPKPRVVICVPSGVTEVEERTVINAAIEAGARRVYLFEEPPAAGLGANLDINGPNGHMVVDIGGGTTDIAVLTMNGVHASSSLKVAGNTFDEAIVRYLRRKHGLVVGQITAEEIKTEIGHVVDHVDAMRMYVSGRDATTGVSKSFEIYSTELVEVLQRPARQIADEVLAVFENTSPELCNDIVKNGITLTGGGSLLNGMGELISARTGINCAIADNASDQVALGCGKAIDWISSMQEGPINIARRRAMRE